MARQRNSCEKCSFSSRKGKVTQGTKKPHWLENALPHKEEDVSSNTALLTFGSYLLQWLITSLCVGVGFFCWVWVCCCCWGFCWFGLVLSGFFDWLGHLVDFSRIITHVLWKSLNAEANAPLWDTEHATHELATVLSRDHTYPVLSGKLEAPYIQSNGDISCPGSIWT